MSPQQREGFRNVHYDGGDVFGGSEENSVSVLEDEESGSGGVVLSGTGTGKNELESTTDKSGEGNNDGASSTSKAELAQAETQMVNLSKFVVVTVIVVLAAVVGALTYLLLRAQEQSEYERQFRAIADEIISITHIRARSIFENLESVGVALTTQARTANATWPFVVFPDFQVAGMLSNRITGASTLTIHPLVRDEDVEEWGRFSQDHQWWIERGHIYDAHVEPRLYQRAWFNSSDNYTELEESDRWNVTGIRPTLWTIDEQGEERILSERRDYYAPFWQRAPAADFSPFANLDIHSLPIFEKVIDGMLETDHPVMTRVTDATFLKNNYDRRFAPDEKDEPHIYLLSPLYDSMWNNRTTVGFLSAFFRLDNFFKDVLPETETGVLVVLEGSCGQERYSYVIDGHEAQYVGAVNLAEGTDTEYMGKSFDIAPFALLEEADGQEYCQYKARVYPSEQWKSKFFTKQPWTYAIAVVACFVVTTLVFVMYDVLVQRRQKKVMDSATKTHAIVSSLFPSNVRDRLMEEMQAAEKRKNEPKQEAHPMDPRSSDAVTSEAIFGSKPIAELFPNTTIMFADMVGFTAWASIREPTQVFMLLESVYHSFDTIARARRVFKVETIGDCYVACAGLPTARDDHAVCMARFAWDCRNKMNKLVRQLEGTLGPDTGDLAMRIGLHSGQVTAGVLRGDKGRFQLFGDSMNTASRIESTGLRNRIHLSEECANLLIARGKQKWVTPREDKVIAKGKGELQTYWLQIKSDSSRDGSVGESAASTEFTSSDTSNHETAPMPTPDSPMPKAVTDVHTQRKVQRLVKWNVEILSKMLVEIVARRISGTSRTSRKSIPRNSMAISHPSSGNFLDEVKDVLPIPPLNPNAIQNQVDPKTIVLPERVYNQLEDFVSEIAAFYHDNPFHNFEHASHVTMSTTKLLSRIFNPGKDNATRPEEGGNLVTELHDYSLGITSDPLVQFAAVLSALVHDVDHPGVSNSVLVDEEDPMATKYRNKSVAEQNSLEKTWSLLMKREYDDLRVCIYSDEEEMQRFRSTLVNLVLSTDIMDKELGAQRKDRWERAFNKECDSSSPGACEAVEATNRKATIVLEHLIQASDVAHTMQHWHVFRKWNERLFCELYIAFLEGRAKTDPADFWYQGELGFFDHYIIPLARKLEVCGVFGVSSDEYLNYALANRKEWERKGQDTVKEYIANFEAKHRSSSVKQC